MDTSLPPLCKITYFINLRLNKYSSTLAGGPKHENTCVKINF